MGRAIETIVWMASQHVREDREGRLTSVSVIKTTSKLMRYGILRIVLAVHSLVVVENQDVSEQVDVISRPGSLTSTNMIKSFSLNSRAAV